MASLEVRWGMQLNVASMAVCRLAEAYRLGWTWRVLQLASMASSLLLYHRRSILCC